MTKMEKTTHFSRRSLLKAGGALVVSVGMPIGARYRARHWQMHSHRVASPRSRPISCRLISP